MKRFFSFLLALSMVLPLLFVPAGAANIADNTTAATENCPCGCEKTLEAVEWMPWNVNSAGSVESGHYYLEGNYLQDKQYSIGASKTVVLDLRGNTLTTAEASRLFLIYGYAAVLDTVGGGRMCARSTGTGNGGVMMVSKDSAASKGGVFEVFSGTLTQDAAGNGAADRLASAAYGKNRK